jgi:NAD(P) transhydrogenase
VLVEDESGQTRSLAARFILIATGSHPYHPPAIDFTDPDIHDSESIIAGLANPFQSILVVGGGPVACEYASIFCALGLEVTLLDANPRLLSFMDAEIGEGLAGIFRKEGMRLLQGQAGTRFGRDASGLAVTLANGRVLRPEKLLFAAGRSGNTAGLGLEEAGVQTDSRGHVIVDEHFQTCVPGVYAAGDVIGPPALASMAMEQGRVAACHAFGISFKEHVDSNAPSGVYSIPEVAMVGLTEEAARQRGIDCEVGRASFSRNSRSMVSGLTDGLVKLVFRRDDRSLLGVHIIGSSATELIHIGQAVLHFGGTIDYFIHSTFDVPTESEAYKYAAYDGLQRLSAS